MDILPYEARQDYAWRGTLAETFCKYSRSYANGVVPSSGVAHGLNTKAILHMGNTLKSQQDSLLSLMHEKVYGHDVRDQRN